MKDLILIFIFVLSLGIILSSCDKDDTNSSGIAATTFGHDSINIDEIPVDWINKAKENLHIAYGHTSHGSQIITGMTGLMNWKEGDLYNWTDGVSDDGLDIDELFCCRRSWSQWRY